MFPSWSNGLEGTALKRLSALCATSKNKEKIFEVAFLKRIYVWQPPQKHEQVEGTKS